MQCTTLPRSPLSESSRERALTRDNDIAMLGNTRPLFEHHPHCDRDRPDASRCTSRTPHMRAYGSCDNAHRLFDMPNHEQELFRSHCTPLQRAQLIHTQFTSRSELTARRALKNKGSIDGPPPSTELHDHHHLGSAFNTHSKHPAIENHKRTPWQSKLPDVTHQLLNCSFLSALPTDRVKARCFDVTKNHEHGAAELRLWIRDVR